jgi:hypothetical protein
VAPDSGVRVYAHVIKEDSVSPNILFLGTEFGLWVSPDGGKQWAQYKGHEFPCVAVRDIVVQPRESDLIVATHGRGIWIVDDISPLRKLTPEVLAKDAAFLDGKPSQQRLNAEGGWPEGSAAFAGADPPQGAWITYYQKKRHIFGKMKLEVYDSHGKLVDTLPSNNRRGISRVVWPMKVKAPRVPPAAVAAFEASEGPRVVPGTYTVKMTRGKETFSTQLVIVLDPRAKFTVADRQQQFDAVMNVHALLGDMSYDVDRINGVRQELLERSQEVKGDAVLTKHLQDLAQQVDTIRRKIVATKEGGAITGEERLREKTTQLYGALSQYEGRPADYQLARIDSLRKELGDVETEFDVFVAKELPSANKSLKQKKVKEIQPISRKDWDAANSDEGSSTAPMSRQGFWERD